MSRVTAHILEEANTLPLGELKHLIAHLSKLHTSKVSQALPSAHERKILQKINEAVPLSLRTRWQELMTKQQYESLSEAETQELHHLVDAVGECESKRLDLLVELAKLRGVTILQW